MRKNERAVTEVQGILDIIRGCSVCSLAFNGDGYPYTVPVNFGVSEKDGKFVFYIHGSGEGTKMKLLLQDGRTAFSMYCEETAEIYEKACASTMRYQSVCGYGRMEEVTDLEEKLVGLSCVMKQYDKSGRTSFDFAPGAVDVTTVLRLTVEQITGKVNKKPE